ncbi:MAG: protein translocase subunit SecF [Parcubacteria group bacterium]|nr:protein translocase subunit SecF [Parcubacteria group bacterium]
MFVIKHKNIFFIFSGLIVALAVFSLFFFGLKMSIEFTGGSLMEVSYAGERPSPRDVASLAEELLGEKSAVQEMGENGFILRTRELTSTEHAELLSHLSFAGTYTPLEERYTLVGPSIGQELRSKAWYAILLVLFGIALFIMFAFRSKEEKDGADASGPAGWQYGAIALVTLAHDVVVPVGLFAFLGSLFVNAEINTLFVTALLAIFGYSVHDTIVVFDRVREHVRRDKEEHRHEPLATLVGKSLSATYVRSMNTSLTTLLALLALIFFGDSATFYFAIALAAGITAGTYSSIFLAAPLLLTFQKSSGR